MSTKEMKGLKINVTFQTRIMGKEHNPEEDITKERSYSIDINDNFFTVHRRLHGLLETINEDAEKFEDKYNWKVCEVHASWYSET